MFTSSTTTSLPLLPQDHDQTGNPSSSSSFYHNPSQSNDDQLYHLSFDDASDYHYLSLFDPPNNYHDYSSYSSNLVACFAQEGTPVLKESAINAAAATSTDLSSDGSINTANYTPPPSNFDMNEFRRGRVDAGSRIAFRMKTKLEIVDDGYRWRKYGKKKIKSNPNLRNYYRCSTMGCSVKKRVERDRDDSSYVITAYDGVHNHESPSMLHENNELPTAEWNFMSFS